MQIGKWGNNLAIPISVAAAEALGFREGDEVEIGVQDGKAFLMRQADQESERKQALARLKALGWTLPPGYRFDRDEANAR